jgi:O-antigen/teichoic acid export membrane protein
MQPQVARPHDSRMNIVFRGGAEITGLFLGLISTVWVSRAVGPSYFGYYAVALTVSALATSGINAGLSTAGSQRVANEPERAGEIWWAVLVGRVAIAVPAIGLALVILAVVPIAPVLHDFLVVGLLVWALLPFQTAWLLVAEGRLRAIAMIPVLGSVASVLVAVLFIHGPSDAGRLPFVPVAFAAVSAIVSMALVGRTWSPRRPVEPGPRAVLRAYLRDGLHYLKSDVSVFIYTSSDRLFLYVFATPAVVGLYDAAYRVIQPFYLISAVVGDSMYLQLAQAFGTDRLRPTFRRYVDLMCFATIPLGFFLLAFSPPVISILYGPRYGAASAYLAILGWVITFGYTSGIAVVPFSAWNRPREYGNSTLLGGALNLGLNFALIPPYEGFGAAWATVAAKVAVTLAGIRYFRRATDYPLVRDFVEYASFSAAAFAAAFAASQLLPYPAISGITAFGLTYVGLVAVVRWRRYRPLTAATLGAIVPERPDVCERPRKVQGDRHE